MLAPRHPERFGTVASLLASSGLRWQLRSEWERPGAIAGGVLLLDTIGELASLYEFADIAFVGGSLVPRGGHNVLEAAQFGAPILVGPSQKTFATSSKFFATPTPCGLSTLQSLTPTVLQLLENDDERAALGDRALEVMRSQQGATQTTVERAATFACHTCSQSSGGEAGVNPLSAIYSAVTRTRNEFYDRGVLSARRLHGPVVSIGNIAAGGSGKTPFVIALGEMLKRRGVSFDVLSRGYGRKTKGVALVDPDG